ncbi:MAG: YtxH domain-containing protein [Cyclobacteriaceae bacterium]|nr:YtxH domain-containing protein [Cyclobacteriaceae bacterium]
MKNSANIFLGILGAATAGVIIGMLIAPEKGETLRGNLKGTASDLAKRLGDLIASGKDHYDEVRSTAMDEANDFKNELRAEANNAYKKAKASI